MPGLTFIRWAIRSGLERGQLGSPSTCPSVWLPLYLLVGVGVGMQGAYCCLGWQSPARGLATSPQFPPGWFKADARVGHSLAMWPHPCHL